MPLIQNGKSVELWSILLVSRNERSTLGFLLKVSRALFRRTIVDGAFFVKPEFIVRNQTRGSRIFASGVTRIQ